MKIRKIYTGKLSPQAGLALSFFLLIVIGAVLLSLPVSTTGDRVSLIDAIFTATSATCVTGLVVVDTGSHWSLFGQIVILVLIQLGGLGIMTFSSFVIVLFARRLGMWDRGVLEQSFAGDAKMSPRFLLWMIILLTLVLESLGATLLTVRFAQDYPTLQALYLGIFHSISAFCNSGFSLLQNSMMSYRDDYIINLTVMTLIIFGGLGFWVLYDLKNIFTPKIKSHTISLHTRLVITVTLVLVLFGFVALFGLEWHNALVNMPIMEKLMAALFQSVTARTAGFNTLDIAALTNSSIFVLLILMLIGASPGSCGGGIKTTTFVIVLAMIYTRMKNGKQVQLCNRGIPDSTVSKAIGITSLAIVLIVIVCFLLLITEGPAHPDSAERTLFINVAFEVVSAFGTVGLSMGLTSQLSTIGKILIMSMMYIGRLGPITLVLALAGNQAKTIRYAEDNVWVG
ncbi:hypothetical protein JXA70_05880 [candidate division KSB1 bacterium]|nr:hypothetical protein [candidate division KSB1 bacterium]